MLKIKFWINSKRLPKFIEMKISRKCKWILLCDWPSLFFIPHKHYFFFDVLSFSFANRPQNGTTMLIISFVMKRSSLLFLTWTIVLPFFLQSQISIMVRVGRFFHHCLIFRNIISCDTQLWPPIAWVVIALAPISMSTTLTYKLLLLRTLSGVLFQLNLLKFFFDEQWSR